jgi:hypothetical protein
MFDITTLTTALAIALVFATWAAVLRIVGGADPAGLGAVFGRPWEPSWPRGVQEEEPVRWRLERSTRRAAPASMRALPPAPECDACDEAAAA